MLNLIPDSSKIFIFQANSFISNDDVLRIEQEMTTFIPTWATHGEKLTADFEIVDNLFLIVGIDESFVATSGCSKDSLTNKVKEIDKKLNTNFFDRLTLSFINADNKIELIDFFNFKLMLTKGAIKLSTIVFNNLIETKSDLKDNWKVMVKNSWHKTLMSVS